MFSKLKVFYVFWEVIKMATKTEDYDESKIAIQRRLGGGFGDGFRMVEKNPGATSGFRMGVRAGAIAEMENGFPAVFTLTQGDTGVKVVDVEFED